MAEKEQVIQDQVEQKAFTIWQRLRWQYWAGTILKILLPAIGIFLLADGISRIFSFNQGYMLLLLAVLMAAAWWLGRRFLNFHREGLINYLNHRYRWLEFSTQLIPVPVEHSLQQLQRQRIMHVLVEKQKEVQAWPDLRMWWIAFACVTAIYTIFRLFESPAVSMQQPAKVQQLALPVMPENLLGKLPAITSLQIQVKPPAYTRQAAWFASELSIEAPENSSILWKCQLSASVDTLQVIWNGTDTLHVPDGGVGLYSWKKQLKASLFYQFRYGLQGNWYISPVYPLHAIDDQPPVITLQTPEPYTFVLYGQQTQLPVSLQLTDDYGLGKARLVATVSRGSGESVKFREAVLAFSEDMAGKKNAMLQKQLDFLSLGMEPGDELYFFAEAWDQAKPPNKSRSDTYFVQWEDTASQKTALMPGIALDNMPAYFRSQRQIIIDTEKLIREQKTLPDQTFKERSNDIGVDQKVLRLRYGQFLGEEFEINTGGAPTAGEQHSHNSHAEEQDHAEDHSRHSSLEDVHGHAEEAPATVFGQPGGMLQSYQHRHDVEEAATLFDDAIKAQLKAALAQMWESELRLRTLRPREALPYAYKALELIKAIQQKSRVYVERVGFEPPPLKPAEKRLTGELNEVLDPERTWDVQAIERAYPYLRGTIAVLEKIRNDAAVTLSDAGISILEEGSKELATVVLLQPGLGVQALNKLRNIISGEKPDADVISWLQQQITRLLPKETQKPGTRLTGAAPELDLFIQELKK